MKRHRQAIDAYTRSGQQMILALAVIWSLVVALIIVGFA